MTAAVDLPKLLVLLTDRTAMASRAVLMTGVLTAGAFMSSRTLSRRP